MIWHILITINLVVVFFNTLFLIRNRIEFWWYTALLVYCPLVNVWALIHYRMLSGLFDEKYDNTLKYNNLCKTRRKQTKLED